MNVDDHLNQVALRQTLFKPGTMREIACRIMESMLSLGMAYPDEMAIPPLDKKDSNCVGSAVRCLTKAGLIERTGLYRRSGKEASAGRTVFQYRCCNGPLARTFLARNGQPVNPRQQELF